MSAGAIDRAGGSRVRCSKREFAFGRLARQPKTVLVLFDFSAMIADMPPSAPIVGAVRGRGAKSNRSGRFESAAREDFDDGWSEQDAVPPRLDDSLTALKSRTIISRNDSPDVGFEQSINPYVGCSHGCIYYPVTHWSSATRPVVPVAQALRPHRQLRDG
jgi:hypothetical protein